MKVLLIDDEPLARKRLRTLLAGESDVQVVGECGSAAEARVAIAELKPEVVLLDVQMPQENGIQLANWCVGETFPLVIFITAHAAFAVDAFEIRAFDYLLKPVRPERLKQALMRAREELEKAKGTPGSQSVDLRRLVVKTGGQVLFINVLDIDWVEAARNYMVVHSAGKSHVVRETLTTLERGLPMREFIRLNRSVIVKLSAVMSIQKTGRGEYDAILKDGRSFVVTCGLKELQQRMK
jgi:DNA-binding LytR/AlgR family response regulator